METGWRWGGGRVEEGGERERWKEGGKDLRKEEWRKGTIREGGSAGFATQNVSIQLAMRACIM